MILVGFIERRPSWSIDPGCETETAGEYDTSPPALPPLRGKPHLDVAFSTAFDIIGSHLPVASSNASFYLSITNVAVTWPDSVALSSIAFFTISGNFVFRSRTSKV